MTADIRKVKPSALRAATLTMVSVLAVLLSACTSQTTVHSLGGESMPLKTTASRPEELHIAQVALQSGDTKMARTIYERVVARDPQSIEGLTGMGDVLYGVNDFTRAGVYYNRVLAISPDSFGALVGQARVALREHQFGKAAGLYRSMLAKQAGNTVAAAGLSTALDMTGDHAGAQKVLRDALALNPGDPFLSTNLGMSLLAQGDTKAAIATLLDVTRYPAAPAQAKANLALAYGLQGDDRLAAALLASDMPAQDVQNNLHYYAWLRTHRGVHLAASITPVSGADATAPSLAVSTVRVPVTQ